MSYWYYKRPTRGGSQVAHLGFVNWTAFGAHGGNRKKRNYSTEEKKSFKIMTPSNIFWTQEALYVEILFKIVITWIFELN